MNKQQFLLLKLAEECAEVAQRASKQIQFGRDESQKDHAPTGAPVESKSNSERLKEELLDLLSIWSMLEDVNEISKWTIEEAVESHDKKKIKLQKYLDLSYSLGQLPEIRL